MKTIQKKEEKIFSVMEFQKELTEKGITEKKNTQITFEQQYGREERQENTYKNSTNTNEGWFHEGGKESKQEEHQSLKGDIPREEND